MAIYKLDMKIFSRGRGSCVTRVAAYRAGERIRDGRTGAFHNFTVRDDVVHKEVLLPSQFSGRADMEWARDRATLWNTVEETGLRNARLGRDVLVALPGELTAVQRVQLARRFGQELADRYLGAVDVAVHLPRSGSPDIGHHAHLMMTSRQVTPEGIGARTILELSGTELRARGLGPSKNELLPIREPPVTAGFKHRLRVARVRTVLRSPGLSRRRLARLRASPARNGVILLVRRRAGRGTARGKIEHLSVERRIKAIVRPELLM